MRTLQFFFTWVLFAGLANAEAAPEHGSLGSSAEGVESNTVIIYRPKQNAALGGINYRL